MIDVPYYSGDGKQLGTLQIDESIFGKIKKKLLHQLVIAYESNQRQGTASTKRKSEVEGSSKKPWIQKHTGRARHGMIRSPIWRHGGIIHGPKPRDYSQTITKRMREVGLNSAVLGKLVDKQVGVVKEIPIPNGKPKTKNVSSLLKQIGYKRNLLLCTESYDRNTFLSARNIPSVQTLPLSDINAYHVLRFNNVLFTRPAFEKLVGSRKGVVKEVPLEDVTT
jgi:large subunit ribosomal protein L4